MIRVLCAVVLSASLFAPLARAADVVRTPITADTLDPTAFAEWVDGAERKIESSDAKDGRSPKQVIATDKSIPGHGGFTFGAGKAPGPRHLRVGLTQATPVGAIMVRGGVRVSVLKDGAAYPGDVADDSQWIPADRIKQAKVSRDEGVRDNYILWTLPAVTKTRALRFTHVAEVTERDYAGWLGGAYVLPTRVANVATQGTPVVSENDRYAGKLNNEHTDPTWEQWANMAQNSAGDRPAVISAQDPEWVMLTWAAPVKVSGVGAAFAGFSEADVEVFTGPADVHPREGSAAMWQKVGAYSGLQVKYPATLSVAWLAFDKEVTTRALRVRMTKSMGGGMHPHMKDHAKSGKRVWLGELVVLSPVADGADLKTAIVPAAGEGEKPPIAVKFTLPEAGWVTLVIEDAAGKRVRNLISETYYETGDNVAWWDGSDDLGRDPSAAKHGLYYIPARPVEPGTYRVRGLWRKKLEAKYEMGVYTHGSTPWETGDRTGGWLSNHTPPSGMLFVPDAPTADGKTKPSMLIGSYVSEGTAGLAWVDLDGNKWRGQNWVGGLWTGAPHLARDAGPKAIAGNYAYVAAAWSAGDSKDKKAPPQGEIRLTALTAKEDKPVVKYNFTPVAGEEDDEGHKVRWEEQIGGVAARDGLVAIALPSTNKLIVVDLAAGKVVGERAMETPRGMVFDGQGRLCVLSGARLVRFAAVTSGDAAKWAEPEVIVGAGLDAPHGLALDDSGHFYVTDRGQSHQIKVFDVAGKSVRSIGKPGAPKAGPYDPQHMNNPRGIAVDPQGRVWVAEEDYQPKRISVWNAADGKLLRAFYGPAEYGGGGAVDPQDKSKFYYYGMEFRLDWDKGSNDLAHVYYRPTPGGWRLPFRAGKPQNAIYVGGKRFWTNAHNSNPTGGHGSAFIFAERDGIAVPVAGAGRATDWDLLKTPAFASLWPAGTDPKGNAHGDKAAFFVWSDLNADGSPQPDEVKLRRTPTGSVMVGDDLSLAVSRFNGKAVQFKPTSITAQGVPVYDLAAEAVLVDGANSPPSSGGDQVLVGPGGWTIHTTAPKPFAGSGVGGAKDGKPVWQYPSLWPGLHASHEAPVPDRAGMIVGHTRLLGGLINPSGRDPLFLINANDGPVHAFTYDGLYVAQIMQDMRVGLPWRMPVAQRGMVINDLTPSDENFWPTVTQTPDGAVYLVTGRPNAIARIHGLETVTRIAPTDLQVTPEDLNKARDYFARAEAARQAAAGRATMTVSVGGAAPTVDGKLDDWAGGDWVDVDRRGVRAYFNSKSEPYNVTAAVAVGGDRLFAAWRTNDKDLLKNAGDMPSAPFKTGGALDLMIGSSEPAAGDKRQAPAPGDVRLLITQVGGKTRALVYRAAVAPGEVKQPVPFSSPGRTITFDRVDDVSDRVKLAADGAGDFEVSVPLATIGLKPEAGRSIRGDVGVLRGTGTTTTQRVYWSNKATAIVADVPSEAELRPALWGRWEFREKK